MLPKAFYEENRRRLLETLPENSVAVLFAGHAPRQSADAYYPFFANRNFLYLTGMEEEHLIYLAVKRGGTAEEAIYLQQEDPMQERWFGRRIHAADVPERYGFADCRYIESFEDDFDRLAADQSLDRLWLDFDRESLDEQSSEARQFAARAAAAWPWLRLGDLRSRMQTLRTIKQPCEIDAMRRAVPITRAGIEAMMTACRPGMKEYELKAEFDYALARRGVLTPAFPSIICSGQNNFCIHYYDYTGTVADGDMVLNDVGAWQDYECNDVSRTWPANGKFTERQKALYQCIYNTSEHMFYIIKPGMPMRSIDQLAREYCFGQLTKLGIIDDFKDIRKIMWHDGAHHIGFDVHDVIDYSRPTEAGMVFCVDVGVYYEPWGIGFRLEDNCLVTETGCENLTASIPRTVEEIETFMAAR